MSRALGRIFLTSANAAIRKLTPLIARRPPTYTIVPASGAGIGCETAVGPYSEKSTPFGTTVDLLLHLLSTTWLMLPLSVTISSQRVTIHRDTLSPSGGEQTSEPWAQTTNGFPKTALVMRPGTPL